MCTSGPGGRGSGTHPGRRREDGYPFGLEELIALLRGSAGLAETLRSIADYSVRATPDVRGAAVRVVGDRAMTVVAGASTTRLAESLQDELLEGPAVDAFAQGRIVVCGSLEESPSWRRFGPRVVRLGLNSAMSIPLLLPATPVGVLTVYSSAKHAFGDMHAAMAKHYMAPTAALIYNAYLLDRDRQLVAQLTQALEIRPPIDRAVGIMMSRTAKSPEQALESLRHISNVRHTKLTTLAREVVDEAVRRARRRSGGCSEEQYP